MVALAIGLALLLVISLVYLGAKNVFGYANNTVRMSEDANYALEMVAREIRMASYAGCAGTYATMSSGTPAVLTYVPNLDLISGQNHSLSQADAQSLNPFFGTAALAGDPSPTGVFTAFNSVRGFDATFAAARTALGSSSAYTLSTTDPVLYVAGGSNEAVQINAATTSPSAALTIHGNPYGWKDMTLFVISDCGKSEVFQADSVTATAITHAATVNDSASFSADYGNDALVMPLTSSLFFLATPKTGAAKPSLYRRHFNGNLGTASSNAGVTSEELVTHVEAIEFQYGENTTNDATGQPTYLADVYRTSAGAVVDWSRVVSVRIGLVLSSEDDNLTPDTSAAFPWLRGTFSAVSDRRLRRTYGTTVTIRNRMGL